MPMLRRAAPILAGVESSAEPPGELVLELLEARRFGTRYEPLVEVASGRTVAHEALARFAARDGTPLPPGPVLAWLHRIPGLLFETELALKALQLERAPAGDLFLNVDPDGYVWSPGGGAPFRALLGAASRRVVVEAIENLERPEAARADAMVADLRRAGIPVALDDLGAERSLHSFEALVSADYFKFDRSLLRTLRDPRRRALVQALVGMAHRCGVLTVLEGVESPADLAAAAELGMDLAQGYLFSDRFVEVPPPASGPKGGRRTMPCD